MVDPEWWISGVWDGCPIRHYLEQRDVTAIFRFLHARGLSYGVIAAAVGISPNRAAEIAKGVRQVSAYDVLERVAVGLSIPRTSMGLGRPADLNQQRSGPLDSRSGPHQSGESQGQAPNHLRLAATSAPIALARIRTGLDEALASASVSSRQLELIEESTAELVLIYPATPPAVMLSRLTTECAEVQVLSRRRQPALIQARLSATAALLATMCADALMRLGHVGEARLWYRTAIHAADDSAEGPIRVLVRAQAAMLPYYFGDPRQAVSTTDAALAVAAPPCPSGTLAAAGRARALARIGAADAAREGIEQARRLFDECGDADSDAAFRFPAKRLLLYLSGALTWVGDTSAAYRCQDEALRLYGTASAAPIDPALIGLDRAMCLARDRRGAEAAMVAYEAIDGLPRSQRTEIVLTRAEDVTASIPPAEHRGQVTIVTEYIRACRQQASTLAPGTAPFDP